MLTELSKRVNLDLKFIEQIISCMHDWVRVVDSEGNVLYMNKAMCEGLGCNLIGQKCYTATGKASPCENCITRKAIFEGVIHEKEEAIKDKIYSVMSSPMYNTEGQIVAAVEVLRDITRMKSLQKKVEEQNNKLMKNLDAAKKLQHSLLPIDFNDSRLDFAFLYRPCESLSGDSLNIFHIDDDHVGMYIGDVSGHGISASMLTVFLSTNLDRSEISPSKALAKLYSKFNEVRILQDMYITVFYIVLDLKNKTLTYSNAGHGVIPFVFGQNKLTLLQSPGIPISDWLPEPEYIDKQINIESGDSIFFYTDGISELKNAINHQFGEDKLLSIVQTTDGSSSYILDTLYTELREFAGEDSMHNLSDDMTVALAKLL